MKEQDSTASDNLLSDFVEKNFVLLFEKFSGNGDNEIQSSLIKWRY